MALRNDTWNGLLASTSAGTHTGMHLRLSLPKALARGCGSVVETRLQHSILLLTSLFPYTRMLGSFSDDWRLPRSNDATSRPRSFCFPANTQEAPWCLQNEARLNVECVSFAS